jgi:DNA-directed RNA polymerase subunit RPC12/RpoP
MEALDGNSIAGTMFEYFGTEMTAVTGTCTHCGATNQIAELRVYNRAPSTVVRCPSCGSVVIVLIRVRGTLCADLGSFQLQDAAGEPPLLDPA